MILDTLLRNRLSRKYLQSLSEPYDFITSEDQRIIFDREVNDENVTSLLNKNALMLAQYINLESFNGREWSDPFRHWSRIRNNAIRHGYDDGFKSDNEAAEYIANSMNNGYYRSFIFIGLGGFIGNMIYMIYLAATSTSDRIQTLSRFYEDDIVTLDNVYRMLYEIRKGRTKDIAIVHERNRIESVKVEGDNEKAFSRLLRRGGEVNNKINYSHKWLYTITKMDVMKSYIMETFMNSLTDEKRFDEEEITNILDQYSKNKIAFIGSPDFETRRTLDNYEADFYFFGHHGRETEIIYRPKTESDVATETYGQMEVTEFWAGIYAMTMEFLKWNMVLKTQNLIDRKQRDKIAEKEGYIPSEYDLGTDMFANYNNGCGLEPGSTLSHFKSERKKYSGKIYPSQFRRNFQWPDSPQETKEKEETETLSW
jgi:hypothetical protein